MRNKKNLRGTALVYGLVIMSTVAIILTSIISFVTQNTKYSLQIRDKEKALQIAEAGIDFYRWYLAHNVEGKTTSQIQAFWTSGSPYGVGTPYERDYSDPSEGAIGRYRIEVTPPISGSTIVIVKVTGWTFRYPALTRTIQVRLRRPAWSEYAVLSNNNVRFGNNTSIQGKIFSNGGVHFDGITNNIVSSAVNTYFDSDSDVNGTRAGVWTVWAGEYNTSMGADVFQAGKDFPVLGKDFTSVQADLSYMKTEAQAGTNGSRYFNNTGQGRQITLRNNDTYDIRTVSSYNNTTNAITGYSGGTTNYALPNNGVIFVENNVWISGTINTRKLTVVAANLSSGSQRNVFIGNDIRYTNTNGSDILGIIAQNNVEIILASENDLRIDAALLAQNGRVGRAYYSPPADHRSVITVFGAIASNQRYGFAWTDGTGYTTRNLIYDNNLLYYPPPYFPTGTQYKLDLWEEL